MYLKLPKREIFNRSDFPDFYSGSRRTKSTPCRFWCSQHQVYTVKSEYKNKKTGRIKSSVSDPDWIQIQSGQWIRIREDKKYPMPFQVYIVKSEYKNKKTGRIKSSVSDPDWIQIQSGQWIRIQEGKNDILWIFSCEG
jgi:hypothetical protein